MYSREIIQIQFFFKNVSDKLYRFFRQYTFPLLEIQYQHKYRNIFIYRCILFYYFFFLSGWFRAIVVSNGRFFFFFWKITLYNFIKFDKQIRANRWLRNSWAIRYWVNMIAHLPPYPTRWTVKIDLRLNIVAVTYLANV